MSLWWSGSSVSRVIGTKLTLVLKLGSRIRVSMLNLSVKQVQFLCLLSHFALSLLLISSRIRSPFVFLTLQQ